MTDPNDIESRLIALAAAFLKAPVEKLTIESGVGDLPRWDSFAQVGLITEVETQFDLVFDVDEIAGFATLEDIADALKARVAAAKIA